LSKKSLSSFGHAKLDLVFADLVHAIVTRWTLTLRKLDDSFAQTIRFSRFINNSKVNPSTLLSALWQNAAADYQDRHVLVISDTTTFSFRPFAKRGPLGELSHNTTREGFKAHPSILMDADNYSLYGMGGITLSNRTGAKTKVERQALKVKASKRNSRLFEDKEGVKWLRSPEMAVANAPGAKQYTLIGDREADNYELMTRVRQEGWDFLYRSKENRTIFDEQGHKLDVKLFDWIKTQSIADTLEINLRKTRKRSAHLAKLNLKFGMVNIGISYKKKDNPMPTQLRVYYVEVYEQASTVVGQEKAVHWILLTSHPVNSIDDAIRMLNWYQRRWDIEEIFRSTKLKGLQVEQTKYERTAGIYNVATLALIAAVQIMQLRRSIDHAEFKSAGLMFTEKEQTTLCKLCHKLEKRTSKVINHHQKGTLAYAAWVIARLGGWSGYQSSEKAGPIRLMNGLNRFYQIMDGVYLAEAPDT